MANSTLKMKVLSLIFLISFCLLSFASAATVITTDSVRSVYANYSRMMKSGRLLEASNCLSGLLKPNILLSEREKLAVNNNLGILHKNFGQYETALGYYDAAESIYLTNKFTDNSLLVSIYGNKVNIYTIMGDLKKALEYTEKAIRFVEGSDGASLMKQQTASSLYLNAGIVYSQLNDFDKAFSVFKKSIYLKTIHNFPGKEHVYLQFAKTYAKIGNNHLADRYFNFSIKQAEKENKSITINLVNIYLEYSNFLISVKESSKALTNIQKAMNIALENLGEKNQLTANCYQLMGDYYQTIPNYQKALTYYQKALIAGSKGFNDSKIYANPSITNITLNLWQLRLLQTKAKVLINLADEEIVKSEKINFLSASLNTINLAIEMTNNIRVEYQDAETRLVFNEKQKNVFVSALETALKLYDLSGDRRYLYMAYQATQQCKANELKYEIAKNKSFSNNEIPDSLQNKEKGLKSDIEAYSALIRNESSLAKPDTTKIAYWKDQQFELSRLLEKTIEKIEKTYPRFIDKIKRGNIIPIETIQANLSHDESLIEYLFSEKDAKGNRKLYEFVITSKNLICHTELLDSTITANLSQLKDQFTEENSTANYNQVNQLLFDAYRILIQPIEKHFTGKHLIIIPDDEISYLPFDAFLTSWTMKKRIINYAELAFLIRNFTISYAYSTNTLWSNQLKAQILPTVIGFAPDYSISNTADAKKYSALRSNYKEVESILNNFNGTILKAGQATIANFRSNMGRGAILHLAMHSELDTIQSGSSSLIFTTDISKSGNYRLHNYEIGQMNINSPMVVLSACNTGNGKLYSGEGLMSLARNFVLAGVPSVVETLWPVEDFASSKIMGSFYSYLSQGKPKNEALRQAKLDYINSTSPSYVNPRFWAAYTLIGDVSPVRLIWWKEPWIIIPMIILILTLGILILYRLRFLRMT